MRNKSYLLKYFLKNGKREKAGVANLLCYKLKKHFEFKIF